MGVNVVDFVGRDPESLIARLMASVAPSQSGRTGSRASAEVP